MATTTTEELCDALALLRRDPDLSHVFKGDGEDAFRTPSTGCVFLRDAESSVRRRRGSGEMGRPSTALEFLRLRQAERDEMGTTHWLVKHREELTQSEKRRMENRLRAEQLFALADLQYSQFEHNISNPAYSEPMNSVSRGDGSPQPHPRRAGEDAASTVPDEDVSQRNTAQYARHKVDSHFAALDRRLRASSHSPHSASPPRASSLLVTSLAREEEWATQERDRVNTFTTLLEDRDETIVSLKQQLREEQLRHERSILEMKREHDLEMRHADERATLLEGRVQDLAKIFAESTSDAITDARRLLDEAHAAFTRQSEVLREEMAALLQCHQIELDTRLREVVETAELSIRVCRENCSVERIRSTAEEKQRLLEWAREEQESMLRDAQRRVAAELEAQLIETTRAATQRLISESAETVLVPKLEALLGEEVQSFFDASLRGLVEEKVADAQRTVEARVECYLRRAAMEFRGLSVKFILDSSLYASLLLQEADVRKVDAFMAVVMTTLGNDGNTAARVAELSSRVQRLEAELEAERAVAHKLAAQLLSRT